MQLEELDCCWKYKGNLFTCILAGFRKEDLASGLNYDVTRYSRLSAYINIFSILCRKFHVSNIFRLIIKQIYRYFRCKSCEKAKSFIKLYSFPHPAFYCSAKKLVLQRSLYHSDHCEEIRNLKHKKVILQLESCQFSSPNTKNRASNFTYGRMLGT